MEGKIVNYYMIYSNFIKQSSKPVHCWNPVRKPSTFYREGSHGVLNQVFAPKGILSPSPLLAPCEASLLSGLAAGLSNGVKEGIFVFWRFSEGKRRVFLRWQCLNVPRRHSLPHPSPGRHGRRSQSCQPGR